MGKKTEPAASKVRLKKDSLKYYQIYKLQITFQGQIVEHNLQCICNTVTDPVFQGPGMNFWLGIRPSFAAEYLQSRNWRCVDVTLGNINWLTFKINNSDLPLGTP